jgi:hypothetical protein
MSSATPTVAGTIDDVAPRAQDVLRALAWRFGRRSSLSIYAPLLIVCGMPTFVYVMLRLSSPELLSSSWEDPSSLRRLYFIFTAMTLPTLVLIEMAQVRPLYALPLTTRRIVNTQSILGILTVTGVHLLSVLYYRVLFGAPIPFVGPLLFFLPMIFICAGIVALWVDAAWWRAMLALGCLFGFVWWIGRRMSDDALRSDVHWMMPTGIEMLALLAMGTAGYLVMYGTVIRDRRGDTGTWENLEVYLHRLGAWIGRLSRWDRSVKRAAAAPATTTSHDLPTRRALEAYASYEWQTRGLVLPIAALGFGSLSLISAWFDPANWLQSWVLSLPGLLLLGLGINGYFVGMMDGPNLTGELDRYRATRPLSDRQLANLLLRNGLLSGAAALFVTAVLALVVYHYGLLAGVPHVELWASMTSSPQAPVGGVRDYLLTIVACGLAGWAGMGFNLTCAATGRHWIIPTVWLAGLAWVLGSILLGAQLGEERMAEVWQHLLLVLSVLAAIVTVLCYHQAIARRLLERHHWLMMAGLWILGAGMLIAALQHLEMTAMTVLTLVGFGSLVALPVASAPLAIWWNRHR